MYPRRKALSPYVDTGARSIARNMPIIPPSPNEEIVRRTDPVEDDSRSGDEVSPTPPTRGKSEYEDATDPIAIDSCTGATIAASETRCVGAVGLASADPEISSPGRSTHESAYDSESGTM